MAGKGNEKEGIEKLLLSCILKNVRRKNKFYIFVLQVHTWKINFHARLQIDLNLNPKYITTLVQNIS
jgi:hypothetical protein